MIYSKKIIICAMIAFSQNAIIAQITTQPTSVNICGNKTTYFKTKHSYSGTISQNWQVKRSVSSKWVNLTNAGCYSNSTTDSLVITLSPDSINGFEYRYFITLSSGSDSSQLAKLTINSIPVPPSVAANAIYYCQNQTTTQLSASGSSGCTIFWYNSSTGSTGSTTAPTPNSTNAGSTTYYVGQTNNSSLCESSRITITVTIDALPAVTSSPSLVTICEGSNTSFSVSATGTTIQYQWQVDNGSGTYSNITSAGSNPTFSGYNTTTLTLTGVPNTFDGYLFRCIVSGKCNPNAVSSSGKITINRYPRITSQPSSVTTCEGTNTSFSVSANGSGLLYQWQVNNGTGFANISTAGTNPSHLNFNSTTLSVNSVTASNNGFSYRCIISGTCSPAATSNSANLIITTKPQIQTQPSGVVSCEGNTVQFDVSATGSLLSYQWQINKGTGWQDITSSGSTPSYSNHQTNKLQLDNLVQWNDGYLYRCVVSGTCSPTATSNSVKLLVDAKPIIVAEPTNLSICNGQNAQFTCDAIGTRLKYQWQLLSTTGSWLSIDSTPPFNGHSFFNTNKLSVESVKSSTKYRLQISNPGCPMAVSNSAALTVFALPPVNAGIDQEICSGSSTQISAITNWTGLIYEWVPPVGLSNNRIQNPTVSTLTDITYKVIVTDINKCSNSDEVKVTVNSMPKFNYQLDKSAICIGDSAKLELITTDSFDWLPKSSTRKAGKNIIKLSPTQETKYTISFFTSKKCMDNFSIMIRINPNPITDAGANIAICKGEKYELMGSGAQFYQWRKYSTLSNPYISNPIANPSKTITYFLNGTNIYGCQKEDSVVITVNSLPTIDLSSKIESCADVPKQIKINTNGNKIQWEPIANISSSTITDPIFKGDKTTLFNVVVTDANNCSFNKQFNFIVHPNPKVEATANAEQICSSQSVILKTNIDTAFWSGPGVSSSLQQITIAPKMNSTYYLVGKNKFGCINYDTVNIKVTALPKPQIIGDTFLCKNQNWTEFSTIPFYSNSTTKWSVVNGRFATGDVSENVAIHWEKLTTGKISVTETMNTFPYCQGGGEKIINLGRGECINPTTIFVKGNDIKSGILISDNKTYGVYQWGYINKSTKLKTMTCSGKTWCDFKNLDTLTNRYFLLSNGSPPWDATVCPTISYFNPIRYVSTNSESTDKISLYPNPADQFLNFTAPFDVNSIEILDNTGRVIDLMSNVNQVNTSKFSPGNYIIIVKGANNTLSQKFLVSH